jgi:hypothetical protein
MKVEISVIRKTEYTSIVEMDKPTYDRIKAGLDSNIRTTRREAEKDANARIDVKDWQDDDLDSVELFQPIDV